MPSRNAQEWAAPPTLKADEWVDSRIYTDQGIFEEELDRIWKKVWLPMCHESELPEPYDCRLPRTRQENPRVPERLPAPRHDA